MGKEGLWLVIQIAEECQRLVLEEGKCRLGLFAMEECEWAAGTHTYAAEVAYGSHHTLGPMPRERRKKNVTGCTVSKFINVNRSLDANLYLGGGYVCCCAQEILGVISWRLVVVHRGACGGNLKEINYIYNMLYVVNSLKYFCQILVEKNMELKMLTCFGSM